MLCVWMCRSNMFQLCCWQQREQLDYVWIFWRIILKWTLKKCRLWLADSIRSIHNLKLTVIGHDIWQKTMNILPIWCSSERPLCTYTVWYRLLMFTYATHTSHSLIILGRFSKDLEPLTSHYTTKALPSPPYTQFKLNTVCTEGGIRKGQFVYGWNWIG